MRKTTITRTSAAIFGATLLLGAAACSSDEVEDNVNTATDAVNSAADEAGTAIDDATNGDGENSESAEPSEGAEGEQGGETDVETEDVAEGDVPVEVTEVADAASLGAFESAEKAGDNMVVEYENGWVVSSPDNGAHPIVGMIGETWKEDGALGNEVGLPTSGETEIEGGWEQTFTNGTIQWTQDEGGEFSAKYV
ncbi:LGFP repeat-containing protein [Corynebacterium xerosis]|uniref:LGFP repeat-containing protein n=1 Tax=Corynebacterium xerosis TaxID=1725 RepID=UPI0013CE5A12|nr:YtxH domain-containing protein [Corynebacterium xerosis]